jgi:glycosyltransferase involved in cell wall biosynthesis
MMQKPVLEKMFGTKSTRQLLPGVSIFGHLTADTGLGQAARCLSHAIDAARIPANIVNMRTPERNSETDFFSKSQDFYERKVSVTIVPAAYCGLYQVQRAGRRNIMFPFWELKKLPPSIFELMANYDEVWAPSRFIASMFKNTSTSKISVVPQVVLVPASIDEFEYTSNKFRVLTYFDIASFAARKNPRAAIEAFQLAFPRGDEDVEFTIKVHGSDKLGSREWLTALAANDPRIRLIDQTLTRAQLAQLVRECHVFISLHRSEGFGFGPAEALAEGRAVISTDYSGTTDFITPETGYPVDYKMVKLKEGEYPNWEGQEWAEPSIEHAAQHLRNIRSNLGAASAKAMRGRKLLQDKFSPEAVGALIKEKIAAYL